MIESMKVSIIVPVYNVAKYIERCLLSVLNQTWPDLEVILVNDCTPDNSMEIVRRVVASHPRGAVVRCLEHEENRGLSAARNTGILASVGDYLYFLDSDDYISANAIELLADAAVQKRPDFVIGNYEVTGARRWAPPLSLGTGFYEGNALVLSTYVQGKWYINDFTSVVEGYPFICCLVCREAVRRCYLIEGHGNGLTAILQIISANKPASTGKIVGTLHQPFTA